MNETYVSFIESTTQSGCRRRKKSDIASSVILTSASPKVAVITGLLFAVCELIF